MNYYSKATKHAGLYIEFALIKLIRTLLTKLGKYIEVLKCCRVLLDFPLLYLFLYKMKTPKVSSTNRLFIEFIEGLIYKSCALLRL